MRRAAPSLVLSGGNALGAYHLGAWRALEAAGVEPGWIAGASIGAVTAAIIAGNPPGGRTAALARFWAHAAIMDGAAAWLPPLMRAPLQYGQAVASRLMGRSSLFTPRAPDLTGRDPQASLFSLAPMRSLVADLVDFERLNNQAMRLSVLAVDLASGAEIVFDTRRDRIGVDHLMASCALIPDFPPVEIDGALLADGGLSANLPVHLVLGADVAPDDAAAACFAVDLFPSASPLPRGLLQSAQRQSDLIFASQSRRTYGHLQTIWAGRTPGVDVFPIAYEALAEETALKGFDFSAGSLARREARGEADMAGQIARWRAGVNGTPGLTVHYTAL